MIAVGNFVNYVDHYGKRRDALLTAVWGKPEELPAVNLVFVSGDETRSDPYGRQIEHDTSVVHQSKQSAHGNYWYE